MKLEIKTKHTSTRLELDLKGIALIIATALSGTALIRFAKKEQKSDE